MAKDTITLVENGRSSATIVLGHDVAGLAAAAVDDLVRVIAVMSGRSGAPGAALPVIRDGDAVVAGPQVHIGQTAFVKEAGLLPPGLPVNGYRIVTVFAPAAPRLVIAGSHPQGISHGIYGLLTGILGVMWGMSDPLFEDIPIRGTVQVGRTDVTERPSFGFRVFSGVDGDWTRRNRIDSAGRALPYYGHGHNLYHIITPDEHGDHPEYFALIDGKRQIPEHRDGGGPQPCLTHPDVIRITIDKVRKHFDENPETTTFSLCPNDSDRFCQCPPCRALDEGMERYRGRRMTSDSYFYYIESVAKEVLKTHPDRYLGTYAYWTTELPPRRITHLPPNVVVYLTQDSSQYFDPDYEARDRGMLEVWSKVADHLVVYDYYGLGWFTPRVYPGIVARTVPSLPKVNVKGFYCEAYSYWAHSAPMLHLATRVLWDVKKPPEAVLEEWYARMFGEAAPQMRAFYESLERSWMTRPRIGHWFQGLDCLWQQLLQWMPAARDEAWDLIEAAFAGAKTPKTRARVEYVRSGHRLPSLMSHAWEQAHALAPGMADVEARAMRIGQIVKQALAVFRTSVETDLTYGAAYYRGPRAEAALDWWKCDLAIAIEAALADKPGAWSRLTAGNPVLADLAAAAAKPDVRAHWERQDKRMRTMELYR